MLESLGFFLENHSRDTLSTTFKETNLNIYEKPWHVYENLSKLLLDIIDHIEKYNLNNESLLNLIACIIERIQNAWGITFEEAFTNLSLALERIPGLSDDIGSGCGCNCSEPFVFIAEDPSFNPDPEKYYGEQFLQHLYNRFDENNRPLAQILCKFFLKQARFFEMMIWSRHPCFRGLILYDHNNDTFNTDQPQYYPLPVIYITGKQGQEIIRNIENYRINYSIEQYWNDSVDSWNVIGQINGTNPYKNIIIGCLYDGKQCQASADSSVGIGIMLAIACYYKENNITPMYNLRFVAFSGEEAGLHGAYAYHKMHWDEVITGQIPIVIDLNQFAYQQTNPPPALWIFSNHPGYNQTIKTIADDTQFTTLVNNTTALKTQETGKRSPVYLSDNYPFYSGFHRVFCFIKENVSFPPGKWLMHHRDGNNHTEGDVVKNLNPVEVNATAELILNVTKYLTIASNAWFAGDPDITLTDSQYDNNNDPDAVNVSYHIDTDRPHDYTKVRTILTSEDHPVLKRYEKNAIYTSTPDGIDGYLRTMPPQSAPKGYYDLAVFLFNFTGDIDDPDHVKWDDGCYADDYYTLSHIYLAPVNDPPEKPNITNTPTGELDRNEEFPFQATCSDPNSDPLLWFQWRYQTRSINGYKDHYTRWRPSFNGQDTFTQSWRLGGTYNVSVHVKDHILSPDSISPWTNCTVHVRSIFDGAYNNWDPTLLNDFTLHTVAVGQTTSCSGLSPEVTIDHETRGNLTWTWDFGDGNISHDQNASHAYTQPGTYTINVSIHTPDNEYLNCSQNITVLILNSNFQATGDWKPGQQVIFNDTSAGKYNITDWTWDFGDGTYSYTQNTTHTYPNASIYNVTLTVHDTEGHSHNVTHPIWVELDVPDFTQVLSLPNRVGPGEPITIAADLIDNESGLKTIKVNITSPDGTTYRNVSMVNDTLTPYDYTYIFDDTWQTGAYNYSIWTVDNANNTDLISGFNFTGSANATMTICTLKDTYGPFDYVNLTDPPQPTPPSLGVEHLDNGTILHFWNQHDSYYLDNTTGVQLTNHHNHYWSHNVLMLGYHTQTGWHILFRTDELTGFTQTIDTDNTTSINITYTKDLTYQGYPIRLTLTYHLGTYDTNLIVIPSIKNLGTTSIPYTLGFGWEINDIHIDDTTENDTVSIDGTTYLLNQSLNRTYTTLTDTTVFLKENHTDNSISTLYLHWNPSLTYLLQVKSRQGQTNAPVSLFIRIGTLAPGQQKQTQLHWYDALQTTYYFNSYDPKQAWDADPENMVDETNETFAYTKLDGETQLLNGTTCNGTDLGSIQKVEIRACCYREGKNGSITLWPYIQEKGENHTFNVSDVPEWTPWVEVTNNLTSEEHWTWEQVKSLSCEVEAHVDQENEFVFCSMVELRVTYGTAPSITSPEPAYGSIGISLTPWVNVTVADPAGGMMNLTWYTNSTPSTLILYPDGNGSTTGLGRNTGKANYECVDETIANEDEDYVCRQDTTWANDTYLLTDHTDESGVISQVCVVARCERTSEFLFPPVPSEAKIILKVGNNRVLSPVFTPSVYANFSFTRSTNPSNQPWTWSDIDALQAGIAFIGTEGESRCTQLIVYV